mmetsp:Transcript_22180/g.25249  ORF Transcript_22180/g.25249 Transcript_22180/m.25249 type:complete len:116 (-) Transcript_22180:205-552(-)|eukprot:CAMPEP_0194145248 /NCGR_PEP_ID=MMETSP0152-20130528/15954_1 /TAXON_ID=1049557 /ORGANISM="Thalassiothrix antarctica, Strain L6-D1" /LENGTH=115 /DNA_ID=CAMNT_0038845379 /DNA_START=88 /DNA_END=435 /DNA_ORIENTATION=+
MPDLKDYKLAKIFTVEPDELSEEQETMLSAVKEARTTPRDPRFRAHNQAGHCWNRYNEWLVCLKQTSSDEDACKPLRYMAINVCPGIWTEKWDEEREEGLFPGIKVDMKKSQEDE